MKTNDISFLLKSQLLCLLVLVGVSYFLWGIKYFWVTSLTGLFMTLNLLVWAYLVAMLTGNVESSKMKLTFLIITKISLLGLVFFALYQFLSGQSLGIILGVASLPLSFLLQLGRQ